MAETKSYSERGGLRWGRNFFWAGYATWPSAKLFATAESIEITVGFWLFSQQFRFHRSQIKQLSTRRGFYQGLRIEHTRADYEPYFLFMTFHPDRIYEAIEALGYEVAGER